MVTNGRFAGRAMRVGGITVVGVIGCVLPVSAFRPGSVGGEIVMITSYILLAGLIFKNVSEGQGEYSPCLFTLLDSLLIVPKREERADPGHHQYGLPRGHWQRHFHRPDPHVVAQKEGQ